VTVAVLGATLLIGALSAASPERYRATARIIAGSSSATGADTTVDPRELTTGIALLDTPAVREAAARNVPGETAASLAGKVTARVEPDANVIDIAATDDSAKGAAAIANAAAAVFLDQRAANARAGITRTSKALATELRRLEATPGATDEAAAVRRRLSTLLIDKASAGADLQLVGPAQAPPSPFAPRPLATAVMAFLATLALAVLAVLARQRLRPAVSGPRELRRLVGTPVIAQLPGTDRGPGPHLPARVRALARRAPPPPRDEALRQLLGVVLLKLPPGPAANVVVITSVGPAQGATHAAAGLSRALAEAGHPTLALSTDPTVPGLARALGVRVEPRPPRDRGGNGPVHAADLRVVRAPDLETLHVVPEEGLPGDGLALLRPGAVAALFNALQRSAYAYVVVDAPGLITAPDVWLVADYADAVILACPERASADDLAEARHALDTLGVPVLGAVSTGSGVGDGLVAFGARPGRSHDRRDVVSRSSRAAPELWTDPPATASRRRPLHGDAGPAEEPAPDDAHR
jgi:Mrp family chromosome partitioning ATPase/capsular polysaccharide biosynthesis protein